MPWRFPAIMPHSWLAFVDSEADWAKAPTGTTTAKAAVMRIL
jgi:hypothetical protein